MVSLSNVLNSAANGSFVGPQEDLPSLPHSQVVPEQEESGEVRGSGGHSCRGMASPCVHQYPVLRGIPLGWLVYISAGPIQSDRSLT